MGGEDSMIETKPFFSINDNTTKEIQRTKETYIDKGTNTRPTPINVPSYVATTESVLKK